MVGQLIAGRAVRDALFLTEFDATYLPRVMLAAAVLSLASAILVGRAMPHWGPRATAVAIASAHGTMFILEGALLELAPRVTAAFAYIHVSATGALVVSAFSSVVNERFDPHYAKTVVARVGIGATLGGVLGGAVAFFLADSFDLSYALHGLGSISILIALGSWSIGRSRQPTRESEADAKFGMQTIGKDPHLRRVALTVLLLGAVGVFVDYAMKAEADARFTDSGSLLSFFSAFYVVTALLTFLMQAGVARPLLRRVGLGGTIAVLPVAVALTAGIGAVWTQLWTAVAARGTQTVVSSSLFRSSYELLYTPVPPMKKRATKALIDIASNRIGYGIGSLIVMAIVALSASASTAASWVLAAATVASLGSALLIRKLHGGYVSELATNLRDGTIALDSDDIVDATTLHTLAKTGGAFDRREILESIKELERSGKIDLDAARRATWLSQSKDLLSDEPQRVLNVLLDESLSSHLASHVIDLLAVDRYARPAYRALERMGPRIVGQLVDAMLAEDTEVAVRRRIPRLLRKIEDARAVQGLVAGLRDEEFDVRYRCGHALASMRSANPSLDLPAPLCMEAVERELGADEQQWQHRRLRDEVSEDMQSEIDALLDAREDRNLQHVFTLLSLALGRDAIVLSLKAISSQDGNLRGTGLEYLHNVLPPSVREPLWPRLTERSETLRARSTRSSPEELLQSMRSIMPDADRLEK